MTHACLQGRETAKLESKPASAPKQLDSFLLCFPATQVLPGLAGTGRSAPVCACPVPSVFCARGCSDLSTNMKVLIFALAALFSLCSAQSVERTIDLPPNSCTLVEVASVTDVYSVISSASFLDVSSASVDAFLSQNSAEVRTSARTSLVQGRAPVQSPLLRTLRLQHSRYDWITRTACAASALPCHGLCAR